MTSKPTLPHVDHTVVARFPPGYFLENLAVRSDGSILVTVLSHHELWLVPTDHRGGAADPVLLHTFAHAANGIAEVGPDVFAVSVTDMYGTGESRLMRVDLRNSTPGDPVAVAEICRFDDRARGLNGSCLVGPRTVLLADCFAGLIWRVDLTDDAHDGTARVWLAHDTMAHDPGSAVPPPAQPGVNGVRYDAETGHLYYTSTAQRVFMRVAVDPDTLDAAGAPEFVAAIDNGDDFCLDGEFAYVTRHRGNTLDRVPLAPRHGSEVYHVAGDPFDEQLVGPSSMVWGRGPDDRGKIGYVTTDGGTAASPDGITRDALLLRVGLRPAADPGSGE